MIGTVAPRQSGGLVLALQNGIAFFNPSTDNIEDQIKIDPDPRTRFNDGKCDPHGRLWVGTDSTSSVAPLGTASSLGDLRASPAPG